MKDGECLIVTIMTPWQCFWNPRKAARKVNTLTCDFAQLTSYMEQIIDRYKKKSRKDVKDAIIQVRKELEHHAYEAGYAKGRADASEVPDLKEVINKRDQLRTESFRAGVDAARKKDES